MANESQFEQPIEIAADEFEHSLEYTNSKFQIGSNPERIKFYKIYNNELKKCPNGIRKA